MRANHLRSARLIHIGQKLRIPGGGDHATPAAHAVEATLHTDHRATTVYRVRSGDVLGAIAHRYGVGVHALMRANHLHSATLIHVGQKLRIPAHGTTASAHRASYVVHRVSAGQTISGIARRYGASIASILHFNGLHDADLLRVGMTLKIPR
jgi:FOG: LysM repeat